MTGTDVRAWLAEHHGELRGAWLVAVAAALDDPALTAAELEVCIDFRAECGDAGISDDALRQTVRAWLVRGE